MQKGNTVIAWDNTPTDEEQSVVDGCLSGDGETSTDAVGTGTTESTQTTVTVTATETMTTETTATPKGDLVDGKAIFLGTSGCTACHTLADAGSTGNVGPNLDDAQPSFDLAYDRVTNGQGEMPSFGTSLTDQRRTDVAAYVSAVAGR